MQASTHSRSRQHAALRQPLAYPLPPPRALRWCLLLPAGLAWVLGALWMAYSAPASWQIAVMACLVALQVFCVLNLPLWAPGTFLRWTGTKWSFVTGNQAADGELRALVVAWDAQRWLLIKAQWVTPTGARQRWLLLMRATAPERWPDIRRVLYSSLGMDAVQIPNNSSGT